MRVGFFLGYPSFPFTKIKRIKQRDVFRKGLNTALTATEELVFALKYARQQGYLTPSSEWITFGHNSRFTFYHELTVTNLSWGPIYAWLQHLVNVTSSGRLLKRRICREQMWFEFDPMNIRYFKDRLVRSVAFKLLSWTIFVIYKCVTICGWMWVDK